MNILTTFSELEIEIFKDVENALELLRVSQLSHIRHRSVLSRCKVSARIEENPLAEDIIRGHIPSYPLSPCIILHYLLMGYRESLPLETRQRPRTSLILSADILLLFYSDHALTFSFDLLVLPVRRTVATWKVIGTY